MLRTLRMFALAGLLALLIFVAVEYAFTVGAIPSFMNPVSEFLREALITTAFALTFTSGVVAVVTCLPRRQYRWAVVFVVLLVLATYRPFFAALILNGTEGLRLDAPPLPALLLDPAIVQNIPTLLLALLVFIYSFQRPRASGAAGATTSRQAHGT